MEIVNAVHGNHAPSMPGRSSAAKLPQISASSSERSCVLDFDIDNFKSYNEVYGFDKGDAVMQCLNQILSRNIPREYIVGQDGEEDFIAVATPSDADIICRHVIEEFDRVSPGFYSESDWSRGYIVSRNRHGIEEIYPLMSITVAGLSGTTSENISKSDNVTGISDIPCKIKSICI
jgi:GGDEF domain-containing protein